MVSLLWFRALRFRRAFLSSNLSLSMVALSVVVLVLGACSGVETKNTYPTTAQQRRVAQYGSLASDKGGITLFGGDDANAATAQTPFAVNGYLWRATLETLRFLPLATTDTFGGVITTDWYADPSNPNERVRLNVMIVDRSLRADGVRVTVFRQTRDTRDGWVDAPVSATTGTALEEAILTRARQLKMAAREEKAR